MRARRDRSGHPPCRQCGEMRTHPRERRAPTWQVWQRPAPYFGHVTLARSLARSLAFFASMAPRAYTFDGMDTTHEQIHSEGQLSEMTSTFGTIRHERDCGELEKEAACHCHGAVR
eukprot:353510-Chlamydomonas_euryale.AAC.6